MQVLESFLPQLRASTLADRVADAIRQRKEGGDLSVGAKLPSGVALSQQSGVSIAVVREALARLSSQGLIHSPRSGSVVVARSEPMGFKIGAHAVWDPPSLAQLFDFRIDLETASAAHAAYAFRCSLG